MRAPALVLVLLAGCVSEHDVDVFVVVPRVRVQQSIHAEVETTCELADLDRVEVEVWGPGPERFTISSSDCVDDVEREAVGFLHSSQDPLRLERLMGDWYRTRITIYGADGTVRGVRELPFHAGESSQLIVGFFRPDLPGWPMHDALLTVPACDEDPDLATVSLTLTPDQSITSGTEVELDCAVAPAVAVSLPRGPVLVEAEGRLADETPCYALTEEIVVAGDDATFTLELEDLCAL